MPTKPTNNPKTPVAPLSDNYGHLQPQALDAERAVLGALLVDAYAYSIVCEILKPETFYDPRHQKIYQAICELNMAQKPTDVVTVPEQLKADGNLDAVGGEQYIVELSSRVSSSAHVEYHARILANKYTARQLISFASIVETNAFDETVDIDALMQKTENDLFELSQKNLRKEYTQIDPVVGQAMELISKAAAGKSGLTGVPSGFHKLDHLTSGWQDSDLIILAGRPAMGKTSFALSMAKNIAVDYQKPVAFFSLEMNNIQLVNRLISNVCEIRGSTILSGQLYKDDWERLDKRINNLLGAPIYVDDTPGLSIFELRTKARRLVREHNIKVIMIDYLQLMTASGLRFSNRQEEVSNISRSLKQLAKELNIPIIALSQLNRNVESREGSEGKRPQLNDLRESGAIEQDADIVLLVHRPEYYHIYQDAKGNDLHGKALIIIAKHRKGAIDDVMLNFRGEYTRFEDLDYSPLSSPEGLNGGEIMNSKINGDSPIPLSYGNPFGDSDMGMERSDDVPY